MSYMINEACISCGACADECPVECISEGDERYVINADECVDCGILCRSMPCGCSTTR